MSNRSSTDSVAVGSPEWRRSLLEPYTPPSFWQDTFGPDGTEASGADGYVPKFRMPLINTPTPIERLYLPELPEDTAPVYLKRDDMTGGIEAMGNKSRKLEFLVADAVDKGASCIVTAGGTQSNHVRQTAAACAKLRLPVEVVVRRDSPGTNGNVLLNDLFGARLHVFEAEAMKAHKYKDLTGRPAAMTEVGDQHGGDRPYLVPVGGSNAIGTWGYIECVGEMSDQVHRGVGVRGLTGRGGSNATSVAGTDLWDHIGTVVSTVGSGGTIAGLGLGLYCYNKVMTDAVGAANAKPIQLQGYGICDSPTEFYDCINNDMLAGVIPRTAVDGSPAASVVPCVKAEQLMKLYDAKGEGYAKSTTEELQFLSRVARECGVVFDRCYTAKALRAFWQDLKTPTRGSDTTSDGRGYLFLHTGGAPSTFDAETQLRNAS